MIRQIAFALALGAAGPASALSCLAPTVSGTYGYADASAENYVIAYGGITATGPSNPPQGAVAQGGDRNQMVGYTQPARFDGMVFTSSGFTQAWNQQIIADVTCVASWCGSYQDAEGALFFFRQGDDGTYWLDIGACPGNIFRNATQADLQQVSQCYHGGGC